MPDSMHATFAVLTSWGRTPDRAARTAPARQAQLDRFEKAVRAEFPDASDRQVQQMADARMRAFYVGLAKRSAAARRARKAARRTGGDEAA